MSQTLPHTANILLPLNDEIVPKVLLVDDRPENLIATEKVLKPLCAEFFRAGSGNEALSLVLRHRFAIVLLDVQMPDMDGFETAVLMRESENMQGVPIIFATAISKDEKHTFIAAELGAADYIYKPVNPDILRSKIKVYLDLYIEREKMARMNRVLVQSNEELERFAYICSHDMQEPVRMMNMFSGMLMQHYEGKLDEKGKSYLDFIYSGAKRLHRMIDDILAFSRVGREEVRIEQVNTGEIVQEVLNSFQDILTRTSAQINCGPLPTITSSATLLRVLLQNLISNALKFHDGRRTPQVEIGAEQQGESWRFFVRDNGIGISPEYHDQIFAIFQRLNRNEDYPGTGIGLSTCQKLVRLYGGKIDFTSELGKGSEFYFTLPESRS